MRCAVCARPLGYGALCLSVVHEAIETVNLCTSCRRTLLGAEVDDRVGRLMRLKGWTQPRLPDI